MDKFTTLTGVAAPLPMANVDTDKIIPARFLKTIKRTGWGVPLFEGTAGVCAEPGAVSQGGDPDRA